MSGALLATIGTSTAASGGSIAPAAMAWSNCFGQIVASTNVLTVSVAGGAKATITASLTGTGELVAILNGKWTPYTGAFNVSNGDTLGWSILIGSSGATSGTVTVKSAGGTFTVGTFTYVVKSFSLSFL